MNDDIKNKSINILAIPTRSLEILRENDINVIGNLAKKRRTDLKRMGLDLSEINRIDIELQLLGLSLKGSI